MHLGDPVGVWGCVFGAVGNGAGLIFLMKKNY